MKQFLFLVICFSLLTGCSSPMKNTEYSSQESGHEVTNEIQDFSETTNTGTYSSETPPKTEIPTPENIQTWNKQIMIFAPEISDIGKSQITNASFWIGYSDDLLWVPETCEENLPQCKPYQNTLSFISNDAKNTSFNAKQPVGGWTMRLGFSGKITNNGIIGFSQNIQGIPVQNSGISSWGYSSTIMPSSIPDESIFVTEYEPELSNGFSIMKKQGAVYNNTGTLLAHATSGEENTYSFEVLSPYDRGTLSHIDGVRIDLSKMRDFFQELDQTNDQGWVRNFVINLNLKQQNITEASIITIENERIPLNIIRGNLSDTPAEATIYFDSISGDTSRSVTRIVLPNRSFQLGEKQSINSLTQIGSIEFLYQ